MRACWFETRSRNKHCQKALLLFRYPVHVFLITFKQRVIFFTDVSFNVDEGHSNYFGRVVSNIEYTQMATVMMFYV